MRMSAACRDSAEDSKVVTNRLKLWTRCEQRKVDKSSQQGEGSEDRQQPHQHYCKLKQSAGPSDCITATARLNDVEHAVKVSVHGHTSQAPCCNIAAVGSAIS
jgi:hypothetical protein